MSLRPFAALALAIGLVTCSDANTAPNPRGIGRAQFAFAPRFTERADEAAASGIVTFDNVRVTITRPPSTVLLDTTRAFAPGDSDLNLRLAVDAKSGEQLVATIEYRKDTSVVYEGTANVTAQPDPGPGTGGGQATQVTVDYVGPGASATKVVLTPDSADLSSSGTLQLSATATDDTGKVFADAPILWTSSNDTVATVSSSGLVTAQGKRGAVTITAATPTGISATAKLTFTPPGTKIVVVSGDRQTGEVGTALAQPLVVEVEADDDGPVARQTVTFRTTGGSISPDTVITDSQGRATATMTLGRNVGVNVFFGQFGSSVAAVSATAIAGAPDSLDVSATPQLPNANSAVQLSAQLRDRFGNDAAVAGVSVTWSGGTGGTFSSTTTLTDSTGLAKTTFRTGARAAATYSITAATDAVHGTLSLTAAPPTAPARVLLLDPVTLEPLTTAPSYTLIAGGEGPTSAPIAQVVDSAGMGVPGAGLLVTVVSNGATVFALPPIPTDTLGRFPLDSVQIDGVFRTVGSYSVQLSSVDITTPTSIGITIEAATITKKAGDAQTGVAGQTLAVAPSVTVTDPHGNPAANVDVNFAVTTGGGHLATTGGIKTDASGNATAGAWTLGETVGTQTLVVSVDGGPSVTFTATATAAVGAASKLALVSPLPSGSVSGVAVGNPLQVIVEDANGHAVTGVSPTITATVSSGFALRGGAQESASSTTGIASFSALRVVGSGSATLTFSSEGLQPASFSVNVSPAPPAALEVDGTSISFNEGTLPDRLPRARVVDSTGVAVPGASVILSVLSADATIFKDTLASGSDGYVTMPSAAADTVFRAPGSYTVQFTSTGISTPATIAVTVGGVASKLALAAPAPNASVSGVAVGNPLQVLLEDANGHQVTGLAPTVVVTVSDGFTLRGTAEETVNATTGVASFSALRVVGSGSATLTFSSTGLQPATLSVNVSPAPAATLELDGSSTLAFDQGTVPDALPRVRVVDSTGVPVPETTVIFAVLSSEVPVFADTLATGSDGYVSMPTTGIASIPAGAYTVVASAAGLSGSPLQVQVTVRPPTVGALNILGQPTSLKNNEVGEIAAQVHVVDSHSAALAGATVIASASRLTGTGALTVLNGQATTDASGNASFNGLRVVGGVGNFTLSFSVSGSSVSPVTSSTIQLLAGAAIHIDTSGPGTVVQTVGPSQVDASNLPAAVVTDTSANPVSGANVTWTTEDPCMSGVSLGSPAASDASGIATSPAISIPLEETGSCSVVAHLTHGGRTDSATFSLVVAPSRTLVYTANSRVDPTLWSDVNNWSAHRLPTATDTVLINASVAAKATPKLDVSSAAIGALSMETGGMLDMNGNSLTIAGDLTGISANLDTAGVIFGSGTITMTSSSGSNLSGIIEQAHLIIGGTSCGEMPFSVTYLLAAATTIQCPLKLSDESLVFAGGSFETQGSGTIQMDSPDAVLVVGNDDGTASVTFNGGDETGLITDGNLIFEGNFTQSGDTHSFVSSASSIVTFLDTQPQTLTFSSPGSEASRFWNLELDNPSGITAASNLVADAVDLYGTLTMTRGTTIQAQVADLEAGSAINGPGYADFSNCYADSTATISIHSALGGVLSCSGLISASARPRTLRPLTAASASLIPRFSPKLGARSVRSRRAEACAILRQTNRAPARTLQAVCRQ